MTTPCGIRQEHPPFQGRQLEGQAVELEGAELGIESQGAADNARAPACPAERRTSARSRMTSSSTLNGLVK